MESALYSERLFFPADQKDHLGCIFRTQYATEPH